MELAKKNIVSILCGVVALAAIVFYFIGVTPKYSALTKQMEQETAKLQDVNHLLTKPRNLPSVVDGAVKPLTVFPNPTVIHTAEELVAQLGQQADDMMKTAVKINQENHELLVANALPRPVDVIKDSFRRQYNEVLKRDGKPDPKFTKSLNLPDTVLQSAEPPTDEEIQKAKDKIYTDDYKPLIVTVNGLEKNKAEVDADFFKATETFEEDFRKKRAANYKLYLEPTALAPLPAVADPKLQLPSLQDMWCAQMALWVQQDVCTGIAALNNSRPEFRNIPTCPVKHLLSVDIKPDMSMYAVKQANGATVVAVPGAPAPDATAIGVKDYVQSPTGRICNGLYDVVHFSIDVVVDAKAVKALVEQLQYGRYVNVLQMDVQGVDLDESLEEGFEYGKRPVVELRLQCEALYLRDWTAWIPAPKPAEGAPPAQPTQGPMPLEVQIQLGIPQPAATPAAVAGG